MLASNNPSMGNLELSLHIDRIDCFEDHVVVRLCRLGALTGAVEFFAAPGEESDAGQEACPATDPKPVKPRRRARLRIDDADSPGDDLKAIALWAADPHRFAGLDDRWFEEIVFEIPRKVSWAEAHAEDVYRRKQESGLSLNKLVGEFGVSRPTLAHAVRIAERRRSRSSEVNSDE